MSLNYLFRKLVLEQANPPVDSSATEDETFFFVRARPNSPDSEKPIDEATLEEGTEVNEKESSMVDKEEMDRQKRVKMSLIDLVDHTFTKYPVKTGGLATLHENLMGLFHHNQTAAFRLYEASWQSAYVTDHITKEQLSAEQVRLETIFDQFNRVFELDYAHLGYGGYPTTYHLSRARDKNEVTIVRPEHRIHTHPRFTSDIYYRLSLGMQLFFFYGSLAKLMGAKERVGDKTAYAVMQFMLKFRMITPYDPDFGFSREVYHFFTADNPMTIPKEIIDYWVSTKDIPMDVRLLIFFSMFRMLASVRYGANRLTKFAQKYMKNMVLDCFGEKQKLVFIFPRSDMIEKETWDKNSFQFDFTRGVFCHPSLELDFENQ